MGPYIPVLCSDKKGVGILIFALQFGLAFCAHHFQFRSDQLKDGETSMTVECHINVELCGLFSVGVRLDVKSVLKK